MKTYIALFRGINVGGRHSLPMKELAEILNELGCRNVKTYIQSGNAVFTSASNAPKQLSGKIAAEIEARRGFEPHILLLSLDEFKNVIANNPFRAAESDPQYLHVGFLAGLPRKPDLQTLEKYRSNGEQFRLVERAFYLHAPKGIGRSKLAANAERLLGVAMTDRNWRTVRTIMELANEER